MHLRFPDGQLRQVADYLATSARRPGTVIVELDPYTVHRLLLAVRLRPAGLRELLSRLATAGMLTQDPSRDDEYLGVHTDDAAAPDDQHPRHRAWRLTSRGDDMPTSFRVARAPGLPSVAGGAPRPTTEAVTGWTRELADARSTP